MTGREDHVQCSECPNNGPSQQNIIISELLLRPSATFLYLVYKTNYFLSTGISCVLETNVSLHDISVVCPLLRLSTCFQLRAIRSVDWKVLKQRMQPSTWFHYSFYSYKTWLTRATVEAALGGRAHTHDQWCQMGHRSWVSEILCTCMYINYYFINIKEILTCTK